MFHRRFLALGIVAVALAGCGGNGGGSTPPTPSDRPVVPNESSTFTGTLSEVFANNYISGGPATPVTTTESSTVSDVITTTGSATAPTYTAIETDTGTLRTASSQTVTKATVTGTSPQVIRALSTTYSDTTGGAPGTGTVTTTAYGPNNGELDVLPETAGAAITNDAQETYVEYDPGQVGVTPLVGGICAEPLPWTIDREVAANGTYSQCTSGVTGTGAAVDDIAIGSAGFTATLTLNAVAGGRTYTFGAPNGTTIPYTYANGTTGATTNFTSPDWITANHVTAPVTETDTISKVANLPGACATYYAPANAIAQTVTTADPALGTLETRATTTYDYPGIGTVCVLITDTIGEYYDYTETTGLARLTPTPDTTGLTPVQSITITEALGFQNLAYAAASARQTASSQSQTSLSAPRTLFTESIAHFIHQEAKRRLALFQKRGGLTK